MDHEIQYIKHIKEYFKNIDVIIEDLNDYPTHTPDIFEKREDKEKIQWQEVAWQYDDALNEESQIRECLYPAMYALNHHMEKIKAEGHEVIPIIRLMKIKISPKVSHMVLDYFWV